MAIRFLLKYRQFVENTRVVEIGCGTGIVGLISAGGISSYLVLTDGNIDAVAIAAQNVKQLTSAANFSKISCRELLWGSRSDVDKMLESFIDIFDKDSTEYKIEINELIKNPLIGKTSARKYFEVVLGCELFYYRTNIEDLLATVLHLTNNSGIFIHSHIFRRCGQDIEMTNFLARYNWITLEIPIECFIEEEELSLHPEFYNVNCLMSGTKEAMENILATMTADIDDDDRHGGNTCRSEMVLKWKIFKGLSKEVLQQDKNNEISLENLFLS